MKTIRFYADENLPRAIIEELRRLDYDVLTSYEAQQANKSISDENVLKFANLPRAIIEELRRLDYDVLTSYEAQQANKSISDENVLKFAHERNKIIITLNRDDFVSLHQQGEAHSGIIIFDILLGVTYARILKMLPFLISDSTSSLTTIKFPQKYQR